MKKIISTKEKGITLVALVITVIILLILAGVTLNTALSDNGLFKRAKESAEKYQESEEQEQSALEDITAEMDKISIDYNDYVGCYVTNYNPIKLTDTNPCLIETNTSGHTSQQKFTTEELEWRIWDYDKNSKVIRLISNNSTTQKLTLKGIKGYNNGVYAVNEICRKCYGTGERGVEVANLRRSDVQKVSTYDYKQYKHEENDWKESEKGTIYYGSSKTYNNLTYPKMWIEYDSKWNYGYDGSEEEGNDKEGLIWEKENGFKNETESKKVTEALEFKESYYSHNYEKNEFSNKKYCELLFEDSNGGNTEKMSSWLASRYNNLRSTGCVFGMCALVGNSIGGKTMFNCENGMEDGDGHELRPMVSIDLRTSDYRLEKKEIDGVVSFSLEKNS